MSDGHNNDVLPPEIQLGAKLQGNEYGWTIRAFPEALRRAAELGFACLGGQFQFRLPDATCEMYWLSSDSTKRLPDETWVDYCRRSCAEVRSDFDRLVSNTDFRAQASDWSLLESKMVQGYDLLQNLVFVAYFVTEANLASLHETT